MRGSGKAPPRNTLLVCASLPSRGPQTYPSLTPFRPRRLRLTTSWTHMRCWLRLNARYVRERGRTSSRFCCLVAAFCASAVHLYPVYSTSTGTRTPAAMPCRGLRISTRVKPRRDALGALTFAFVKPHIECTPRALASEGGASKDALY